MSSKFVTTAPQKLSSIFASVRTLVIATLLLTLVPSDAQTQTQTQTRNSSKRSPGFETPSRLRPRVDFWKAIFGKYGKYQKVIHHRRFPQVAFKVLDFSKAAEQLSPGSYDALVKRIEMEKIAEVQTHLKNLAETGTPKNSMEHYIVEQMKGLPGGRQKYSDVLEKDWVRTQTGIKEKCAEAVRRTGRYLPQIERIFVDEENLPIELTRLPFIESSFNYTAYSSVGAAGIWQFMPATARKYMMVGSVVDERLDPFTASRAATKYFKQAYKSLGSWGLAVTSYNHGVAGVYKKTVLAKSEDISELIERTTGEPVFGFASQNFFPEFLAAVELFDNYRKVYPGVDLLPELKVRDHVITKPISLPQIAQQLGTSGEALIDANYALLKPVTSGSRPIPAGYTLRVPTQGVTQLIRNDPIYKKDLAREASQPVTEPMVPKVIPPKVNKKGKATSKKSSKVVTKKGRISKKVTATASKSSLRGGAKKVVANKKTTKQQAAPVQKKSGTKK